MKSAWITASVSLTAALAWVIATHWPAPDANIEWRKQTEAACARAAANWPRAAANLSTIESLPAGQMNSMRRDRLDEQRREFEANQAP